MIIYIKTLNNEKFEFDINLEQSVMDLKKLIFEKSNHPIENQKIIYMGRVLNNTDILNHYKIIAGNTLILMVIKNNVPISDKINNTIVHDTHGEEEEEDEEVEDEDEEVEDEDEDEYEETNNNMEHSLQNLINPHTTSNQESGIVSSLYNHLYQNNHYTAEDMIAITSLTNMGFEYNMAAQAYFACDTNEEMAANFLFDNMQ